MFPKNHVFLFTEVLPIIILPHSFHFPFDRKSFSGRTFHYELTSTLSKENPFKCEISANRYDLYCFLHNKYESNIYQNTQNKHIFHFFTLFAVLNLSYLKKKE